MNMIVYSKQTLNYFIQPLKALQKLKESGTIDWKFTALVYLLVFFFTLLISWIIKYFNPKEMGILDAILFFPVFTIPAIIFYTITGSLLFKAFLQNNFLNHLNYSILILSFGFVSGFLTIFLITGFFHDPSDSNTIAALLYLGFLLISRIIINIKLFPDDKNIVVKSVIEALVVFIMIFLGIGIFLLWIFN